MRRGLTSLLIGRPHIEHGVGCQDVVIITIFIDRLALSPAPIPPELLTTARLSPRSLSKTSWGDVVWVFDRGRPDQVSPEQVA